jgi:hypothetical protein
LSDIKRQKVEEQFILERAIKELDQHLEGRYLIEFQILAIQELIEELTSHWVLQDPAYSQRNYLYRVSIGSWGGLLNFFKDILEEFVVHIVYRRRAHFDDLLVVWLEDPQNLLSFHKFALIWQLF